MSSLNYPIYDSPKLIDLALLDIQNNLLNLSWLTNAYGRAKRLVKGKLIYPAVYKGSGEYKSLFPDNSNYSFFLIDDPQDYDWRSNVKGSLTVKLSLIFWFNISKIEASDERNTESLKDDILSLLNKGYKHGSLEINRIYEDTDNIFKGFTIKEVDSQYMMYPYAGFRFEGTLKVKQGC